MSAVLAWALPLALAQETAPPRLPALGDAGAADLSVGDEKRLGEQIMREARRDPALLDDPVLLAYVQSLWRPLVQAARARGDIDASLERLFPWEVFLVQDRSVNAFALPGGYVGVHPGLIAIAQQPCDQPALGAGARTRTSRAAAHRAQHRQLAQRLAGGSGGDPARAGGHPHRQCRCRQRRHPGRPGRGDAGQLNFSREDGEGEADLHGFAVLGGGGFASGGMAQMFERLQGNAAVADSGAFPVPAHAPADRGTHQRSAQPHAAGRARRHAARDAAAHADAGARSGR
ncbi:MAG: hypothetical protein U1F49_00540 [Rubrivivax sp.]